MTGAFLRAQDPTGKWGPIEVEHLNAEKRRELLAHRPMDEVMRWVDVLCQTLVEAEKALGIEEPKTDQPA